MKDVFIDVTFEVPMWELDLQRDPSAYVLEKMRDTADKLCDESGARLRTDRNPEILVKRGVHFLMGEDMLLCASRWAAVAPESVNA